MRSACAMMALVRSTTFCRSSASFAFSLSCTAHQMLPISFDTMLHFWAGHSVLHAYVHLLHPSHRPVGQGLLDPLSHTAAQLTAQS